MIVSQISSPEEHFQWSGEEIGGGGDPFPICKNQLSHNGRERLAPSAQGPGSITVYVYTQMRRGLWLATYNTTIAALMVLTKRLTDKP